MLINNLHQVDLTKKLPLFRKERKCYFLDPLLYSVFNGFATGRYSDYSLGAEDKLIEGIICEALARFGRRNLELSHFLWFYSGRKETDFVVRQGDSLLGVEVKWQARTSERDFANPRSFKQIFLVSKNDFGFSREENLLVVPASVFASLLESPVLAPA